MKTSDYELLLTTLARREDKDSFKNFTTGLSSNWGIVILLLGALWFSSQQVGRISNNERATLDNSQAIEQVANDFSDFKDEIRGEFDTNNSANSDIVRRLDNLQKDLEILKAK